AVAIPAAAAPMPKPSAYSRSTAATSPNAIPRASATTLRFSSSVASSSSRRTRALACSATLLVAGPRRCSWPTSVSRVCMASPVDDLGKQDSRREGGADDQDRRRAAAVLALLLLLRLLSARLGRRGRSRRRWLRGRPFAAGARRDQARLQLAQERGVLGELLGEPLADPVAALARAACELLQPRRAPLDEKVGLDHR